MEKAPYGDIEIFKPRKSKSYVMMAVGVSPNDIPFQNTAIKLNKIKALILTKKGVKGTTHSSHPFHTLTVKVGQDVIIDFNRYEDAEDLFNAIIKKW